MGSEHSEIEEQAAADKAPGRKRKITLALVLGFALVEFALPFAVAELPLSTRMRLPAPLYILGETSKAGLVPDDYVLLLGDSYAAGGGDWLLEVADSGGSPPFQATHILHAETGRDVLTFGSAGSGNVNATAYLASKRFAQLRRSLLGEPTDVVVYFYEGNDLNDNLRRARRYFGTRERSFDSYTPAELDELIAGRARAGWLKGLPGMLYAPYILQKFLQQEVSAGKSSNGRDGIMRQCESIDELLESGEPVTPVRSGETHWLFNHWTQSPGLELTPEETAFALSMLEGSLRWVKQRFEGVSVTLVYLPSPLSCYELSSPTVHVRSYESRAEEYPASEVSLRSDAIRARVRSMAEALELDFVDSTPALREAATFAPVHGPIDGNHLNRRGYEVLGRLLVERFREPK